MDELRGSAASERMPVRHKNHSSWAQRRVLVVDDEQAVRRVLAEMLQIAGFEVIAAAGNEALLALDTHPHPDLVITDMNMPGRNGTQVATDTQTKLPGVPVLIISSNPQTNETLKTLPNSHVAFLPKPFTHHELLSAVTQLLTDGLLPPTATRH